jgi:RNA polymerase sigma-70 factor (ECF subfamily)
MKDFDEESLILLLQNPETQNKAFEVVVRKYSEQLYWQIRRMVLSHDDTNDLLQNTFIKAWTNLNSFRGEARLSTWLYRIAINESLTFLAREHNTQTVDLESPEGNIVDKLEGDTWFNGDDAQKLLQEAISTLPSKQRMVFNLKYFNEMKYEEMSKLLDTSVGALKASYHLAVTKISTFLEKHL